MNVYKANKLKPSTIETYKKHLRAHVLPAFGQREIASIATEDILLFLNERNGHENPASHCGHSTIGMTMNAPKIMMPSRARLMMPLRSAYTPARATSISGTA